LIRLDTTIIDVRLTTIIAVVKFFLSP